MVSAGATGGGINPALAVLQALGDKPEEILWVGSDGGMETDLVRRAGVPFKSIPAAGLHGRGLKAVGGLWKLTQGYFAARKLIREFKPDVLFFTGGYVAIPTGLAGRSVPTLLCVPDIEPALALRTLARFADRIAVPAEKSLEYFPAGKQVQVVGYPTRQEIKPWPRQEAFAAFDLSPEKETLLVMGGSLGARSINRALMAALPSLLPRMQVIHLTGQTTWPEMEEAAKQLPAEFAQNYRAYPFLHERMAAAFTAADLVVSRAGASILGELPAFEVPAILVPYPYAWRYQVVNAEYLTERGAAVLLRDENLNEELLPLVQNLLLEEPDRLMRMSLEMKKLATPDAASKIAEMLVDLSLPSGTSVVRGGAE
jgi:UDP-N-acetylglucosamine--N-acetylmuramyl-(pentapeptide) pyrophosphoryl-undecaprenol N-acetylglucosamine transferase